ncbi:unnamed protein product [Cochlearia groenlandica]
MADNTRSRQLLKEKALMEADESIGERVTSLEGFMETQIRQMAEMIEQLKISNAQKASENSSDQNRSRPIYTEQRDSPDDLEDRAREVRSGHSTNYRGITRTVLKDWETYKMLLRERFEDVFDDPIAELKQLQETDGTSEEAFDAELEL